MASDRIRQVNELLRNEFALEFSRSLELPEGSVISITKVSTSPDMRNATIFVSILPDNKAGSLLKSIRTQLPSISREVASRVVLRSVPKIKVTIDDNERKAAHIESLLDSLKES